MIEGETRIRETLAQLGLDETALADVGATMRAALRERSAPADLPVLGVAPDGTAASSQADLVTRGVLGRGGMGVVHLATQRSLDREVAVKKATGSDPLRAAALVREARVMGRLEHPGIVPAHALGIGDDGSPVLVMKRIEGVSWATLLANASHPAWARLLAGHGDALRVHVEILIQLCHALSFAHSRGVVHRDLKPENVMVGAFGEVLLLDWGLGLRLDERSQEPPGIVGTPGYLAPEMALGDPNRIDERTDVYLLGASLYEVLTGRMPHAAETPLGALASSLTGEIPPPDPSAPHELAQLALEALGDHANRPPSAEAFRERLARFLTSREADVLVQAARTAMERAERASRTHGVASAEALSPLVEARFALTSARTMRPGDAAIEAALEACIVRHVEREIALRSAAGARALLPQLRGASSTLVARLEALERELDTEQRDAARARTEARQADMSGARTTFAAAMTVLVGLGVAYLSGALGAPASSPTGQLVFQLLTFAATGVIFVAERRRLTTDRSRRVAAFMMLWFSYGLAHALVRLFRGETSMDWGIALVSATLVATAGALLAIPRLWATVPVHAIACVCALLWPQQQDLVFNVMFWINAPIVLWTFWPEVRIGERQSSSSDRGTSRGSG